MAIAMMFAGAWLTGATWDEAYHVERFRNFLAHGWYLLSAQSVHGHPAPGVTDQYVYGPATMWLLHGWNLLIGVDRPGVVATTATAYATRHLAVVLISCLGLLGTIGLGKLVLKSWGWGLVAGSVLAVIPLWAGHSMFNVKDVGVATGYTLVTLGLSLALRAERASRGGRLLALFLFVGGVYLSIGTRPGMWTGISVSAALAATLAVLPPKDRGPYPRKTTVAWRLTVMTGSVALASLTLWVLYPRVFGTPVHSAVESAVNSANFLGFKGSRWFVPLHVLLEIPCLLLGFLALGLIAAISRVCRSRLHPGFGTAVLILIGAQAFCMPMTTLVRPAGLYSDLRQLLFATPGAALLITYGIARATQRIRAGADPLGVKLVSVAACAAVVIPVIDQATLFPYNYTYYNVLTDVAGVPAGSDYYRASGRELAPHIPVAGWLTCSPMVSPRGDALRIAHLDGAQNCAHALASPVSPYADDRRGAERPLERGQFWAVSFSDKLPTNCWRIAEVTRRHYFHQEVMSALLRCSQHYATLSTEGISINRKGGGFRLLQNGWYVPGLDASSWARSSGSRATLAFKIANSLHGKTLDLVIDSGSPIDALANVDGHRVRSTVAEGRRKMAIRLPATVTDVSARDPVRVTLTAARPKRPLNLRLERVSLSVSTP